ncbi:telomere binding protein, partial [Coemansia sp. RSA 2603]
EIRQLFRSLEARINDLTTTCSPTEPTSAALLSDNVAKSLHITADPISSSTRDEIGIREINITIPGLSNTRAATRPLIAPISEIEPNPESAPLVALGLVETDALADYEWAQPWIDLAASDSLRQNIGIFAEYLGPWFGRSVLAKAAAPIIKNSIFTTVVEPYISSAAVQHSYVVGWNILAATLDVFASRTESHLVLDIASTLTLATRVVSNAVTNGFTDPRRFLHSMDSTLTAYRSRWAEYLQTVCSFPERLANKIDPHDIPQCLRLLPYFQRLSQEAVTASYDSNHKPMVAELWAKICRVGQTDTLGVEIAAALLFALNSGSETDNSLDNNLMSIAGILALVPIPFRSRLISGLMRQFDIALKVSDPKEFGPRIAVCICALFHGRIGSGESESLSTSDEQINSIISDLITRSGADMLAPKWESMAIYQAMALALQLLAGKGRIEDAIVTNLLVLVPARVYPSLLKNALNRVIIPLWSYGEFITHAPAGAIKSMTALVLMCIGALSEHECKDLVTSVEFMQAVPRFLDSLTPVSKLSGIIVADKVVRLSNTMGDSTLDFGLDDIIRDAKRSNRPEVQASAQYIAEMELLSRPPLDQWQSSDQPLVASSNAVEYLRSYNGSTDTLIDPRDSDSKVFAPRTSSLTDNGASTELQSSFVKPRKPVFLRDCIAYMRESQDGNTELPTIGLFAAVECIEKASEKALNELWVQMANRILYTYNRGSDDLDLDWNTERRRALVALAVRMPESVGPFLADRSCDRNLTLKDREIVYSAIATACLQLSGLDQDPSSKGLIEEVAETSPKSVNGDAVGAGIVVRRSRRLDIVAADAAKSKSPKSMAQQRYASYVGPSFFFPLIAQYGKSDMASDTTSDVRNDASQLERYVNTLAIILYTAGSATHQITMNREFWDLCRLIRQQLGKSGQHLAPPVVDAILFGIDVILSPERALSTPTLAREFRMDIADMLQWIDGLVGSGVLRGPAMAHASRIVHRLQEIQGDVSRRMMSDDFNQFTSII